MGLNLQLSLPPHSPFPPWENYSSVNISFKIEDIFVQEKSTLLLNINNTYFEP